MKKAENKCRGGRKNHTIFSKQVVRDVRPGKHTNARKLSGAT